MSASLTILTRRKKEIERQIKDLQKELAEIERVLKPIEDMAAKLTQSQETPPKKGGGSGPQRARGGAKPAQVVAAAKEILSSASIPLTRGELLSRLHAMDIHIIGTNPANTLGTTLSRHKEVFRNIEGLGYWLADRPYGSVHRNDEEGAEGVAGAVH
jgi:hypothetical protein